MIVPGEGRLLRIFIGEDDRHEGKLLFEWIVREAGKQGMAGATVIRGMEGFGAHSRVHRADMLHLSADLPVVVEIVDKTEKIEDFVQLIDGVIKEGLATIEKVDIRFYRSGRKKKDI